MYPITTTTKITKSVLDTLLSYIKLGSLLNCIQSLCFFAKQADNLVRHNPGTAQSPQDSAQRDDEAPSTSSSAAGSSSAPDLPGFYFDPEKKRYFRLLPGHNNCNPLTRESIQQKEMESKRLKLLEDEDRQKKADTNSDRLFTVNDVKVGGSKYGIISLHGLKTPSPKVRMFENLYFTNRKYAFDIRSVPCHRREFSSALESVPDLSQANAIDRPGMLCSFRIPGAWSCAWSLNIQANHCFSTGLSRRVLLTNVVTGHRQSYGTNSDVLAQQFALLAPLLFNGCRSGEIFAIDLRASNQGKGWKATRLLHNSAVTSVQILQEEDSLMASDMSGKIKLWDLRTSKCLMQFEGHVNEYAYLPLHVHEEEGILVAVGQDCYTRIWSLHDGHLLRTIPSPYPAAKADIPSVAFSSRLGGFRGAPGLLMAVRQDLYCFSYS
ncbi:DDB1- and CUL4-associated factor 4 [Tupaia chinensis]|uniref:DDB1-and CUL4-associated factor 4 n=1 Tax=Tupaia chinensis TaxID=246437 RepID=L8Y674_TUPCH|nr:DDB1- and CUL4-associated factor 4 [Tupaia chinensis]